jgi:hypothetical protein
VSGWQQVDLEPEVEAQIGSEAKVYQRDVEDGHLSVFVTVDDGMLHLSISHRTNLLGPHGRPLPGRLPTWDEVIDARYLFTPDSVTMAMLLPPKEEYVNIHPTTFHLWQI